MLSALLLNLAVALTPSAQAQGLLSSPEMELSSELGDGPDLQVWVEDTLVALMVDGERRFTVPMSPEKTLADGRAVYDDAMLVGSTLLVRRQVTQDQDSSRGVARAVELYDLQGAPVVVDRPALLAELAVVDEQRLSPDGRWAVALVSDGGEVERLAGLVVSGPDGQLHVLRPLAKPLIGWGAGDFQDDVLVLPIDGDKQLHVHASGRQELVGLSS